ncbi:hypothetical protein [Sphingopyxis sp.]|uniref:hypothetical protein n=1 Tax=Sphingopyxis sp. TaxID=1908224 RepID=UPI002ED9A790
MPRLIDPPSGPTLDLAEVTARLDESGVDLTDEASIARCAELLAGLSRNADFLADRVIAALKASYANQLEINRYSAQVFLSLPQPARLLPPREPMAVRTRRRLYRKRPRGLLLRRPARP